MDVLIVDDDDEVRNTLTKLLKRAGFMTVGVYNGLAALNKLRNEECKAVVCDIQMPFQDGTLFHKTLVAQMPAMAKRVIFMTGRASDADIAELEAETGCPVLAKPIDSDELITAVRSLVGRGSLPVGGTEGTE